LDDRVDESLKKPKSYTKNRLNHKAAPNRIIGVSFGAARPMGSLDRVPFLGCIFLKPKSDASPIHQRSVIFFPVTGAVFVFFLGCHAEPDVFFVATKKFTDSRLLEQGRSSPVAIYATTPIRSKKRRFRNDNNNNKRWNENRGSSRGNSI
jgi:hypothetical protein